MLISSQRRLHEGMELQQSLFQASGEHSFSELTTAVQSNKTNDRVEHELTHNEITRRVKDFWCDEALLCVLLKLR